MLLSSVFLVVASACTPDGLDAVPVTLCESGFILDGSTCVPESCGIGRWGNLPIRDDTVYVDVAAEEAGDGTEVAPFTTIQQGLDRAGTLGGELVAVAAGTYPETLEFDSEHADVRLAGRCREMVILDASVGGIAGIQINPGEAAVEVAGVTLSGSSQKGLVVASGVVVLREVGIIGSSNVGVVALHSDSQGMTELVMESCLIDANTNTGLDVYDPNTRVTLWDTTVKGTQPDAKGESGRGIQVSDGAALSADGCLIDGNSELGLLAAGRDTEVNLVDTTVKDTRPDANGMHGRGIQVSDSAALSAEHCLVDGNTEFGLLASDPGTRVTLQDTTVMGTRPDANNEYGWGIEVQDEVILSAEGCMIDGNTEIGLLASSPGTEVTLRDTTVRTTKPDANGEHGRGVEVHDGAFLSAEGCLIDRNTEYGLLASSPGTQVILRDTTVRDSGRGIEVQENAILSAEGCLIDGNTEVGLLASSPGTQVTLRDTTVKDTRPNQSGGGVGIEVHDGAILLAEDCLVDGNTDVGLLASDPGTRVTLRDTTVQETQPDAKGEGGYGIGVQDDATLSAEGCLVDGNTSEGLVAVSPGTQVTLLDTTVRGTQPNANGEFGRGIQVSDGATLSAEGCLVDRNTSEGLIAAAPGTQVTLVDTTVRDTQPDANGEFGRGIEVSDSATLSARGCLIDDNMDVGLLVGASGTQVSLWDSTVRDTRSERNGEHGRGIEVRDGAILSAEGCLVDGNTDIGVFAGEPGTEVTLRDSTIMGTKTASDSMGSTASGAVAQSGAILSADHLAVLSNLGSGLLANGDGAMLECSQCSIIDNQFAGATALQGGTVTITDSSIEGTTPGTNLLGGAGVYAWSWNGGPPTVTLTNNLIYDNPIAGVWLIGDGTYVLTNNTISGGIGEPFGSGSRCGDAILALDGVKAWDGRSGLLLADDVFQDASGSAIFLDGSSALLAGNIYSGNAVDLVVQNQSCDSMPDYYMEAPRRDLCPFYSYPTCYAEFFFVALPSEPVDWEKNDAAHRPRLLPMQPIMPAASLDRHAPAKSFPE